MNNRLAHLLLLTGLLTLSACGGGGGSSTNPTTTTSTAPYNVYSHAAVFSGMSTVYVWGANESGQIGNGTTVSSNLPVRAARFIDYSGIGVAAGANHTIAFQKYGTVRAWGFNGYGQLGNGVTADNQTPNSYTPVFVRKSRSSELLSGIVGVAAGGYFNLAVDRNGNVWSWGFNGNGQLGRQPRFVNSVFVPMSSQTAAPVQRAVDGSPLAGITVVAAGGSHSLALDLNGNVLGWGYNGYGQVGDPMTTGSNRIYPEQIVFTDPAEPGRVVRIVTIAAGGSHSLAVDDRGGVWGWGYNYFGQIGDGTTVDRPTPVKVILPAGSSISLVAAGLDHSLAYDAVHDTLYAWGYNTFGQLGTNSNSDSHLPVAIVGFSLKATLGTLPQLIASKGHNSMARKTDGSWWSWGDNFYGQLGVGSYTNSWSPVRVSGF